MTMPDDRDHKDVSPVARVSADVWEQTKPVGGEDFQGHPAELAKVVTVAGIVQVRDQPTLGAAANRLPTSLTEAKRLVGRAPQRRLITICVDQDVWMATDKGMLEAPTPSGFLLPASTPFPTGYAGEIWVLAKATAGNATFWAEIDQEG